jgi:hypothetical protein
MSRHRIAVAAAALAAAGGGAVVASAATTPAKPITPAAQFQNRLAKELGISTKQLQEAAKVSGTGTVDALKASGRLDGQRAGRLGTAIAAGRSAPFMRLGTLRGRRAGGLRLLAKVLHKQPKELRSALRAGKTPKDIIVAAGKNPEAVRAAITATVRERLQARVTAGTLTAAEADRRATRRAERLTGDASLKHGGRKARRG